MDTEQTTFEGFPIVVPEHIHDVPDMAVKARTIWLVMAWNRHGQYWKVFTDHWWNSGQAIEQAQALSAHWSHRKLLRIEAGA